MGTARHGQKGRRLRPEESARPLAGVERIAPVARFELAPEGPFDLETQAGRFGGWPRLGDALVMTFPVEGWRSSAAVLVRQREGSITGEVHGATDADAERAWKRSQPRDVIGRRQVRSRSKVR